MDSDKKCQAFAKATKEQCKNNASIGSPYCWHHFPKKEPLIMLIVGALIGVIFTAGYDGLKNKYLEEKLKSQTESALNFEFKDNELCWEQNYKILTEDRGALEQEKTKAFQDKNQIWITYRPLCDFSFEFWEYTNLNSLNFINSLGKDESALFMAFYKALKEIQNYNEKREESRKTKENNQQKTKIFEDVNNNVIRLMQKHEIIFKKMETYWQANESMNQDSLKFTIDTTGQNILETAVTGDTVQASASGATVEVNLSRDNKD